jgi:hypothetical protein
MPAAISDLLTPHKWTRSTLFRRFDSIHARRTSRCDVLDRTMSR